MRGRRDVRSRRLTKPTPDVPLPEYEALGFFEGTWTIAELPPEQEFRETCAWLPGGRRHMVCRSQFRTANGALREGLSLFSYDPTAGTYVYYGLRPSGAVETNRGTFDGERWIFTGEDRHGEAIRRRRVTIHRAEGGGYHFLEEAAEGDASWRVVEECRFLTAAPED